MMQAEEIRLVEVLISPVDFLAIVENLETRLRSMMGEASRLRRLIKKRTPAHTRNVGEHLRVQAEVTRLRSLLVKLGRAEVVDVVEPGQVGTSSVEVRS